MERDFKNFVFCVFTVFSSRVNCEIIYIVLQVLDIFNIIGDLIPISVRQENRPARDLNLAFEQFSSIWSIRMNKEKKVVLSFYDIRYVVKQRVGDSPFSFKTTKRNILDGVR